MILLKIFEIGFGGNGNGDHLAAFFGGADGENFHTRRGFLEKAHVLVDIFGVGKNAGRASDVAEDRFGSGNSFAGGKIVDERRGEVRLRGVLENLVGVGLIDGLFGIAAGLGFTVGKGIAAAARAAMASRVILKPDRLRMKTPSSK